MKTVGVVTVARSDYGIYLPVLRLLREATDLELQIIAGGMHLEAKYGRTIDVITADGFPVHAEVPMRLEDDSPCGIAQSMGIGMQGFAAAYAELEPDMLLVLGDRFEMMSAATAALPFSIPLAHIHGGEATEGIIDEAIRHSITKMSHLHFVTTDEYGRRVAQMGEESWRITVSGAPSLDNVASVRMLSRHELMDLTGLRISDSSLIVTFHPVTLAYRRTGEYVHHLLSGLAQVDNDIIFTFPNADTSGRVIIEAMQAFAEREDRAQIAVNLGTEAYFNLMRHARAMVGNSSSGIIEAASFQLPVVNIGDRQRGRVRGANVVDVDCTSDEITAAIRRVCTREFREAIAGMANPYGDGHAAQRILRELRAVELNEELLVKRFRNLPVDATCELSS